ncbi:MAG TPA: hypothetical protein PKO33_03590 [Pyrinomonadaceae bacterium]|nr:hypothetical protein [Pyrinomonadaceae bacterium]
MNDFEVSFNSPQCGFMSIGFVGPEGEFHTTTANTPHAAALPELLSILSGFLDGDDGVRVLQWNRDPEEYDFRFSRTDDELAIQIYEYPTGDRAEDKKELVFSHRGGVREVCGAFAETFRQLFDDRETDEFEFNWRRPFPETEFTELERQLSA